MKPVLTRSTLRDIVLLICCLSALFCSVDSWEIGAGFLLLAFGCFLHVVTKAILVRNVILSEKGVYRFVRHPYYLANYLVDSGFCVLSGNRYLLLIYPFLFFWAYGPTLRKEESFLSSQHEAAFSRHAAEVPQFFPDRASLAYWRTFFEGFSRTRITWKEYGRIARFISLGCVMVLIHEIRADGLVGWVWQVLKPTKLNYDESLFAFGAVLLFVVSRFLLRRGRKSDCVAHTS